MSSIPTPLFLFVCFLDHKYPVFSFSDLLGPPLVLITQTACEENSHFSSHFALLHSVPPPPARQPSTSTNMTTASQAQHLPVLVPQSNPIAGVYDSFNAVVVRGEPVDEIMMRGRGAGEGPTASAVVADLIDAARGINPPLFGTLNAAAATGGGAAQAEAATGEAVEGAAERRFWRLLVDDRPGVIAEVSQVLSDRALSVEKIVQQDADGSRAHIFILTHAAQRTQADEVAAALARLNCMIEPPAVYAVEAL